MSNDTLDKPLTYSLYYEASNQSFMPDTPLHGKPLWTVELMDDSDPTKPTDIKWYTWPADGGWRTPWGRDTKYHSTLASALQECFLHLLQYSGLCEDMLSPPVNIVE